MKNIDSILAVSILSICIIVPMIFSIFFLALRSITCYILKRNKESKAMNQLKSLIKEAKGKFFTIEFVRKDGQVRVINGKNKYNRLIKGGKNTVRAAGYLSAIDRNREDWFSFKPESVITFKCGSIEKTFTV